MPKDLTVQINDAIALLGKAKASMQRAFLRPRTDDRVDFDHDLIGGKYGLLVGFASLGKARLVDCLSHVLGLQGNAVQITAHIGYRQIFYALTCLNSRKTAPVSFAF